MKRLMALFLLLAKIAYASPFLICDPYPAGSDQFTRPVSFVLTGLSPNPLSAPATINSDGTVQLHYDLATLAKGNYSVTVAAVNALGGVGPASPPFRFHQRSSNGPH